MRKLHLFSGAAFLAGILISAPASADQYRVEIPRSDIGLDSFSSLHASPLTGALEFGMSSWLPGSFSLPGRIAATSSFKRDTLPAVYADYVWPLREGSDFRLKGGLSYVALTRQAALGENFTTGSSVEETVNLLSVRLGVEYSSRRLRFRQVLPYVGFSLLPSFAMTDRSAFDDGSLYFGVPGELSAGARVAVSSLGVAWPGAQLQLGVSQTFGTIDHSSVAGFGVNGGVSVGL